MSAARIAPIKSVIRTLDVGVVQERIHALSCHPGGSVRAEIADLARSFGAEVP